MPNIQSLSSATEESGKIGLIIPPPELRNIIDKTANFVARNGKQFEEKIHEKEADNKKFNFLKASDPYYKYYLHKLKEFREGTTVKEEKKIIQNKQQEILKKLTSNKFIPGDPPKQYEYILDPPSLSPVDLDIVKLTAQFVARNGKRFLSELMSREQKNPEFDFLRPQHVLFPYFAKLLEQYTKILIPSKDILEELKADLVENAKDKILKDVEYHANFLKYEMREKKIMEEKAIQEKAAYNSIDWHDFYVVETIEYYPHDQGNFPPPTTPEMVGSRILNEMRMKMDIKDEDDSDIEMQIDSDNDEDRTKAERYEPPAQSYNLCKEEVIKDLKSEDIVIKKYDPKTAQKPIKPEPVEQFLISPFTGEQIPASKIEEHMRISLLDPRWIEQREKLQERMKENSVFATGNTVCSNLKHLAERRTDIFGEGDQETEIGKRIGEEDQKDTRIIWDGHSSSLDSTTRAIQKSFSAETQHKIPKFSNEFKAPPPVPHRPNIHPRKAPAPPIIPNPVVPNTYQMVPPVRSMMPPVIPLPPTSPIYNIQFIPPPPVQMDFNLAPQQQQQQQPMDVCDDNPPVKKSCPENKLIPADEFLKTAPNPIKLQIQVPSITEKSDWNVKGQLLSFELELTESVQVLKQKIQDETGMPPTKQKLAYNGMFLKDGYSLAYYNLTGDSILNLQIKERGGRKK